MAKVQPKAAPFAERRAKKAKLDKVVDTAIAALRSMSDADIVEPIIEDDEAWQTDLQGFSSHHGVTFYLYKQKQ